MLKRKFEFKRKADTIAFLVSLLVCFGWEFYYEPASVLISLWGGGYIEVGKHIMHQVLISVATWMSASKSYDLVVGDKRKERELNRHVQEKENLKAEVDMLRNSNGTQGTKGLDEKVLDILQEKGSD